MTENLFLTPRQVRTWIKSAHFRYPPARKDLTEPLAGFSHLQVFPTLWSMLQANGNTSADALWTGLMTKAEPCAIQAKGLGPIENRARKLVLDFGREVHAMTLLNESFGQVLYKGSADLGPGIDFIVFPISNVKVGIHASMKAYWSEDDWDSIHAIRRTLRGDQEGQIPIVQMTNRKVQPDISSNGTWLYTRKNVIEISEQIDAMGFHRPRPLL